MHNENSMSKEIAKKRAAALGNLPNTREKQKQKYVSKCIYIYFVYKGLECVDLQKRNSKQMYDQKKRRYNNQRINSLLFKQNLLKLNQKQMLKNS